MSTEPSLRGITDFDAVATVERARYVYANADGYAKLETTSLDNREAVLAAQTRIQEQRVPVVTILVPYAERSKLTNFPEWYDPVSRYASIHAGFLGQLMGALVVSDTPEDPWITQPTVVGGLSRVLVRLNRPLLSVDPEVMPPHAQRVLIEFRELSNKLNALHKFVTANPFYSTLPSRQQQLMKTQFEHMDAYAVTLAQRLALF